MCSNETVQEFRPFCSKRCADLDLAKWFNGSYAVPSTDPEDLEDLADAMNEALNTSEDSEKPN
jgi:endogenous inhibitor of DNA gyrase (YacG/DUF329 family)